MAKQESHGRWYGIANKLFNRGLLDDILSNPGKIVSDILSSPATTTQNNEQPANTPAAAQTQTAAAAVPAATTPAAEAPVATTQAPVAKQPAATPAASPKQEQPQEIHTSLPPALVLPSTQQPAPSTSAAPLTTAAKSASRDEVLTTSPPVAAETVPPKAENAASSQVPLQPAVNSKTGAASIEGAVTTKTEATSPTQPSQTLTPGGTSNSTNQGPLVATGVVLGIVVFLGLSLLLFWCLRRKKKADRHDHTAVPSTSPVNEYAPDDRFRDDAVHSYPSMSETNSTVEGDFITHHHPNPAQFTLAQATSPDQHREAPDAVPFAAQPFSYAQAQRYVQSLADTGTFGFPPPPPIPQPSPIRIFRWPTRSSRSGASTPSALTSFRSHKTTSRHQSQVSRSTISSMLWHGRRDIIARSTANPSPAPPYLGLPSNHSNPENTMHDGIHTPVLDWLQWIRGHQQVEPDPEMNHRKSFASTTESSASGASHTRTASTASSGVFSPKADTNKGLSWQLPMSTPSVTPENRPKTDPFNYVPLHLFKPESSKDEGSLGSPGGVRIPYPR